MDRDSTRTGVANVNIDTSKTVAGPLGPTLRLSTTPKLGARDL